jgi:uncharacterized membrane protein YfcA
MGAAETIIIAGAFLGGFSNGLTGFGGALTSVPIWLMVLAPTVTAPLAAAIGVMNQLQTLPSIWRAIQWRLVTPLVFFGALGLPVGALLLPRVELWALKGVLGLLLVSYCLFMLFLRGRLHLEGRSPMAPLVVGFTGGVLGGLAGFSGPAPVVWASLQDWTKEQKRGVFQVFNIAMLSLALIASAVSGVLSERFFAILLLAAPATFIGAALGRRLFRSLDEGRFDRLTLGLLLMSGLLLLGSAFHV